MDRVKSSMQQVPNPIPKALIRRTGGANSFELEKENFERGQAVSINKAINTQEVAVKEKHARNILLKGAHTFWAAVNRLPLSSNAVLCWKFCHVFHKLLRDGHPNVIKDSMRNKADLSDMSRMWGHLSEGYGKLCSIYLKLLITKMEFHVKNPRFPGNLQMSNRQLDEAGENDVNNLAGSIMIHILIYPQLFSSLDMSRSVSVTAAGQCRLAPLIQVILDSSHLYDYTVKLLFKLHSCLPADTLQGHRDRFQEQFKKLKSLFYRSSNLQYFKRLIQIPQLPENPPNFLRASALSEHISPVVVIPAESSSPETEHMVDLVTEDLVDTDIPAQPVAHLNMFDDLFGTSAATDPFNFNSQNGMHKDDKDRLIEQLTREIQALREELESFRLESGRLRQALRGRVDELEAELAEQSHLRMQALGEGEFLRAELDDLRRVKEDTEKEQRSLTEIERKAVANEQRYVKLKEKYTELVQSHADLLRKVGPSRPLTIEEPHPSESWCRLAPTPLSQSRLELSSQLSTVESEKVELVESLSKKEEELAGLGEELERVQSSLASERESGVKTAEALQNQLNEKVCGSCLCACAPVCQPLSECVCVCVCVISDSLTDPMWIGEQGAGPGEPKLRPRGLELQQGELGDLVEQEMAATSAAVESAAARIEDMLNKSRAVDTGVKMEVNERILASCTDLMQAIKVLVLSSKDLQRDIVESGRGAASMKDFYVKNSRWTEGLISASKAVGWGATVMVDAADLVVQGKGKYEELMVCSHEIAASTAQLVAASKVKADKDNANLGRLKLASKGVTQATAGVVASTKSGKSQIEEKDTMDFSSMTLTQIKRQEMDSQVSVLELETKLQKERERLGELRKKHYELAGVAEGWGEEDEGAYVCLNVITQRHYGRNSDCV
uniref:Huntingtin-interacting protein 1-related protein n=1 Tax=Oncorhynchus kisutch TaxID=8019 RepID=A0A8C7JMV5_ONCKI